MADISKEQVDALLRRLAPVREPKFWTDFAQAAFKLGRNAGLEEAKRAALDSIGLTTVSTVERIESLKDNT